jgi:predicted Zn finger-like uncharacterized protein
MDVICPSCNTTYRIADGKIPPNRRVKATCKKCGRKFTIVGPVKQPPPRWTLPETSPQRPEAVAGATGVGKPTVEKPERQDDAQTFSSVAALQFGWQALKKDPVLTIIGMFVVPFCIQMVFETLNGLVPEALWPVSLTLAFVAFVLELAVTLKIAGICLKICDGRPASLRDLHAPISQTPTYLISSILFMLICTGGLIALVIPGILLSMWLQFYGFVIVDEKAGAVEALKKSYAAARGHLGRIFLFSGLVILFNFCGLLLCGMGLLITVPVSFIAWAYLYRSLQGRTPAADSVKSPASYGT